MCKKIDKCNIWEKNILKDFYNFQKTCIMWLFVKSLDIVRDMSCL